MTAGKVKRALISVYDKTGIVEFAGALVSEFGIEIISTGGTAALLKEHGIPVTLVEEITGFPEIMDGRVKTLHPRIHAAILADRDNSKHMRQLEEQGIEPIDMVVVNLYPFEKAAADPSCTFEQAMEMIDIGGSCLLRAAAKNHKHVLVVVDVRMASTVLEALRAGDIGADVRLTAAFRAFSATCAYDAGVAEWMTSHPLLSSMEVKFLQLSKITGLRYGENPHQHAGLFQSMAGSPNGPRLTESLDLHAAEHGMSFNNCVDGTAALELCSELTRELSRNGANHTAVFVKHNNACGVGIADAPVETYRKAYLGDPNAAMGGVLACNFDVDGGFAQVVMETYDRWGQEAGAGAFFLEVWVAPRFDEDAVQVIRSSKEWGRRARLLDVGSMNEKPGPDEMDFKSIAGGMVMQNPDIVGLNEDQWRVVTRRAPSDSQMADLRLAWLICKHTKSNAITICKDGMLIGNGAGQASRVMSCRIATWLARENGHAERLPGSVAASDGFFPFPDGPKVLMDAGVTAIIQPGGSKRDKETIAACDKNGAAMIFTGTRHFKH